jgi:hypothetical protein
MQTPLLVAHVLDPWFWLGRYSNGWELGLPRIGAFLLAVLIETNEFQS